MDITEVLSLTPESLAAGQHDKLKQHSIKILQEILNLLHQEKYDEIEKMLETSPAGDDMGCDNAYIDFKIGTDGADIGYVVGRLMTLKSTAGRPVFKKEDSHA